MKKFSFVMPMVINHRSVEDNDLKRILEIQLPSFRKFLKLEDLHEFFIVSRKEDIETIREALNKEYSDFPFTYIDEKELIPQLKTFPLHQFTVHPGWIIQQLAKLELAKTIETDYFFSFETDLFLTKPFNYNNLFNEDKKLICSYYTDWEANITKDDWHIWSTALVLPGVEVFNLHPKNKNEIVDKELKINKVMGVSPQVLITKEIKNLINHLEDTHKQNYIDLLLRSTRGHPNTWTEYTLYWMWLYKTEKIDEYYSFNPPFISSNDLWGHRYRKGFGEKYFDEFDSLIMKNPNHYFNVVQSNIMEVSIERIANKLKPYLK